MDQFPRMLYKAGGPEEIHGGRFSTLIVNNDDELDAALADGWSMTTPEAVEAAKAVTNQGATTDKLAAPVAQDKLDNAPPTREELKHKATELGLTFAANIPTDKLAALVDEKLEA